MANDLPLMVFPSQGNRFVAICDEFRANILPLLPIFVGFSANYLGFSRGRWLERFAHVALVGCDVTYCHY